MCQQLRCWIGMEKLRRAGVGGYAKTNGNNQVQHAEQVEQYRTSFSSNCLELVCDQWSSRSHDDVADSCWQSPERRHLPVRHQDQKHNTFQAPEMKPCEILLIAEKAPQRPRHCDAYRHRNERDHERDADWRKNLLARLNEGPANRKYSCDQSPHCEHATAQSSNPWIAGRSSFTPQDHKHRNYHCDDARNN